jgi:hypothetical protein
MNVIDRIFIGDLARQAERSGPNRKLIGRALRAGDPGYNDAVFAVEHGMTREQFAEMQRAHARQDFEADAVRDLNGEPAENICNTRGLPPKQARLARFHSWRLQIQRTASELQTKRAEFERMMEAPKHTESALKGEVRRTAARLMGRDVGGAGEGIRKALEDRLSEDRHRAEAAREALPELDKQIEVAELRLKRINERESEFLHPAIVEAADRIGLGKLYLKKIAELRAVTDLIFGLREVVGGYGSGFENSAAVNFPRTGLASLRDTKDAEYRIEPKGNDSLWRQLAQSLLLNPRHDTSRFVALPK